MPGFEPGTSASRTLRANQAALHPEGNGHVSRRPFRPLEPGGCSTVRRSVPGSTGFTSSASASTRLARNRSASRSSSSRIDTSGIRPAEPSRRRSMATASPPMLAICMSRMTRSGLCGRRRRRARPDRASPRSPPAPVRCTTTSRGRGPTCASAATTIVVTAGNLVGAQQVAPRPRAARRSRARRGRARERGRPKRRRCAAPTRRARPVRAARSPRSRRGWRSAPRAGPRRRSDAAPSSAPRARRRSGSVIGVAAGGRGSRPARRPRTGRRPVVAAKYSASSTASRRGDVTSTNAVSSAASSCITC